MAQLTDQLSQSGGVKPVRGAPEFSTGAATAFKALTNIFETVDQSSRQAKQEKRLAAQDAWLSQDRLSTARVEQAYNAAIADSQQLGEIDFSKTSTGIDELFGGGSAVPGEIGDSVDLATTGLTKFKAAAAQGRLPLISFNAALNKRYQELINAYPDHAESIAEAFSKKGLTPSLARVGQTEQSNYDSTLKTQQEVEETAYKTGMQSLPPEASATMTREQIVLRGLSVSNTNFQIDLATKQADLTLKKMNISDAEKKAAQENLDRNLTEILSVDAYNSFSPLATGIQQLSQMIMKNPQGEWQKRFEQLSPQFDQYAANFKAQYIAQARARGLSDDKVAGLEKTIDLSIQRARGLWSGDFSVAQSNQRALSALSTNLKLDTARVMPVFFALQELKMDPTQIEAFSKGVQANEGLRSSLEKEIKGFTGEFGQEKASTHLMNVVRILKGQGRLRDFSPEQARTMMPVLYETTNHLTVSYVQSPTSEGTNSVLHGVGEIINAARSLNPSNADLNSFILATDGSASVRTRRALIKALKDPTYNDQAEATVMGSRAASAQILDSTRAFIDDYNTEYWSVAYDKKAGRYVANFNQKAWDSRRDKGSLRVERMGEIIVHAPQPQPKAMQQLVTVLNTNISNIQELNKYDPNGMKNATPLEIANFYAADIVPESMKKGDKPINPDKEIKAAFAAVDSAFENLTDLNRKVFRTPSTAGEIVENYRDNPNVALTQEAAKTYGVPEDVALRLIKRESSFDNSATATTKKGDTAYGLGQLTGVHEGPVKAMFGKSRSQLTAQENVTYAMKHLADLHKRYGNWQDAVSAYFSGKPFSDKVAQQSDGNMTVEDYVREIAG